MAFDDVEIDLIREAQDARDELANARLNYPKLCAKWLQHSIKNDIKASTTFKVDTTSYFPVITSKYKTYGDLKKQLPTRIPELPPKEMDKLLRDKIQSMDHISSALDILSQRKTNDKI